MVDTEVRVSSHLKEELAWAADKWLWIICFAALALTRLKQGQTKNSY